MVTVGSETLAIPVPAVKGALNVRADEIRTVDGMESVEIEGETVDLVRLARVLQIPAAEPEGPLAVVALRTGRKTLAVVVDEFLNKEEIVIKNLGAFLQGIGPFSGATVTGQGHVILLLDSLKLLEMSAGMPWPRRERDAVAAPAAEAKRRRPARRRLGERARDSSAGCSSVPGSTSSPHGTAPRRSSSWPSGRSTSSSPIWRCRVSTATS